MCLSPVGDYACAAPLTAQAVVACVIDWCGFQQVRPTPWQTDWVMLL